MEAYQTILEPSIRTEGEILTYGPGHCWYYRLGNSPLAIVDIEPRDIRYHLANLPKSKEKLKKHLKQCEEQLKERCDRYNDLLKFDIGWEAPWLNKDDPEWWLMEWATSISLVHNHISYYKTEILACVLTLADEIYKMYPKNGKSKAL